MNTKNPVLRRKEYTEDGRKYVLYVEGGLHHIKGNAAPYFSLTGSVIYRGRDEFGGAIHDTILAHYPELSDLAAMHLSDIYGVPMHAVENAWYHLGGTHWTPANLDVAAKYLRVSLEEAARLASLVPPQDALKSTREAAKAAFVAYVEAQKPRWAEEAKACIEKHGLVVYGDPWTPVA